MEHFIMVFNENLLYGGWLVRIISFSLFVYSCILLVKRRHISKGLVMLFLSAVVLLGVYPITQIVSQAIMQVQHEHF